MVNLSVLESIKRKNDKDFQDSHSKRKRHIHSLLDSELTQKLKIYNQNVSELLLQRQTRCKSPISHFDFFSNWKLDDDSSFTEKALLEKGIILTQTNLIKQTETPPSHSQSPHHEESDDLRNNRMLNDESLSILERAKKDADILKKVAHLRKTGLWSIKQLPKIRESDRSKSHWDYLLEEMRWMATDFKSGGRWKIASASLVSNLCKECYSNTQVDEEITCLNLLKVNVENLDTANWNGESDNLSTNYGVYSHNSNHNLEISDNREYVVVCQLSPTQKRLYNNRIDEIRTMTSSGDFSGFNDILLSLMQICDHPDLVEPHTVRFPFISPQIIHQTSRMIPNMLNSFSNEKPDIIGIFGGNLVEMCKYSAYDLDSIRNIRLQSDFMVTNVSAPPVLRRVGGVDLNFLLNSACLKTCPPIRHGKNINKGYLRREKKTLKFVPIERFRGFSRNFKNIYVSCNRAMWKLSVVEDLSGTWDDDKTKRLSACNDRNHNLRITQPLYGRDLLSLVNVYTTSKSGPSSAICLSNMGDPNSCEAYLSTTATLWNIIKSPLSYKFVSVYDQLFVVMNKVVSTPTILETSGHCRVSTPLVGDVYADFNCEDMISTRLVPITDRKRVKFVCGKLQILDDILKQLQKISKKPVIITKMHKMLDLLEEYLTSYSYRYIRIDNTTCYKQELMNMFCCDSSYFVLIMIARPGHLDMSSLNTVIFYDQEWSDSSLNEITDLPDSLRIADIYRLFNKNTIEECLLKAAHEGRFQKNRNDKTQINDYICRMLDIPRVLDVNIDDDNMKFIECSSCVQMEIQDESSFDFENDFFDEQESDQDEMCRHDQIDSFGKDLFVNPIMDYDPRPQEWENYFFDNKDQELNLNEFGLYESDDYIYGEDIPEIYLPPVVPDSIVPVEVEHTEQIYRSDTGVFTRRTKRNEKHERKLSTFFNQDGNLPGKIEPKRRGDRKLLQTVDAKQEWLIDEEWSILQTSRRLLMRSNLVGSSIASNWNLSSHAVAIRTGYVVSSRLISSRFYSTIGPREEGKYLTELNTRKAVRGRFIFPKTNKQIRTDELYVRDDGFAIQDSMEKLIPIFSVDSLERRHFNLHVCSPKNYFTPNKSLSVEKVETHKGKLQSIYGRQIKLIYFNYICYKYPKKEENTPEILPFKTPSLCFSIKDGIMFFKRITKRYSSIPTNFVKDQSCRIRSKPYLLYCAGVVSGRHRSNAIRVLSSMQYCYFLHLLGHVFPKKGITHLGVLGKNYRFQTRYEQEMILKHQYRRQIEQSELKNPRPVMNSYVDESKYRHYYNKTPQVQYVQNSPNMRPVASPLYSGGYSMPNYVPQSPVPHRSPIGYIPRNPYAHKIPRQMSNMYSQMYDSTGCVTGSPVRRNLSSAYLEEQSRRNNQVTGSIPHRTQMPQQLRSSNINLVGRSGIHVPSLQRRPNSILNRPTYVGMSTPTPTVVSSSPRPIRLHVSNNNGNLRIPTTEPSNRNPYTTTNIGVTLPSSIAWPSSSNLGINNHPYRNQFR